MPKQISSPKKAVARAPTQKLMVSGSFHLELMEKCAVDIRRGMPVLTQDGQEVGAVAAVVLDCASEEITHLLLGRLPPTALYYLAPLHLIQCIDGETVWLSISSVEIETLPVHQPD